MYADVPEDDGALPKLLKKRQFWGVLISLEQKKKHKAIMFLRIICLDLRVRREKLSSMPEIDVFSLQA